MCNQAIQVYIKNTVTFGVFKSKPERFHPCETTSYLKNMLQVNVAHLTMQDENILPIDLYAREYD